jgi:hypothetical protein
MAGGWVTDRSGEAEGDKRKPGFPASTQCRKVSKSVEKCRIVSKPQAGARGRSPIPRFDTVSKSVEKCRIVSKPQARARGRGPIPRFDTVSKSVEKCRIVSDASGGPGGLLHDGFKIERHTGLGITVGEASTGVNEKSETILASHCNFRK